MTRDEKHGVNHLGMQVESDEELARLEAQLKRAAVAMLTESDTICCYANSDKYWVTDPQGVAWETFRSPGNVPVFGESPVSAKSACCTPAARPVDTTASAAGCCGT